MMWSHCYPSVTQNVLLSPPTSTQQIVLVRGMGRVLVVVRANQPIYAQQALIATDQ